jgi:hypothetical protein
MRGRLINGTPFYVLTLRSFLVIIRSQGLLPLAGR